MSRPHRTYRNPAIDRGPLLIGFAAAAIVGLVLAGMYLSGRAEVFSPGLVSSGHAPFGDQCIVCHAPHAGVEAERCERCHDRAATARLAAPAHAALGRRHRSARQTASIDCAGCHGDHRGRSFDMRQVADDRCATCHTFGTMARHPEFAVTAAGVAAGTGLRFSHQRHVTDRRVAAAGGCATCHEETADLHGFVPISFDRHCGSCHLNDGVLAALPQNRIEFGGLRHRDSRVLDPLRRLAADTDPEGERTVRAALVSALTRIEQVLATGFADTPAAPTPDDVEMALRRDIAEIDRRLADTSSFSRAVDVVDDLDRQVRTLEDPSAGPPPRLDGDPTRRADRRAVLLAVLTAIEQRGDPSLAARARAARDRLEQLAPAPSGAATAGQLAERVTAVEALLDALESIPGARSDVDELRGLTMLASDRARGIVSAADVELRRRELMDRLARIAARDAKAADRIDAVRKNVERALSPAIDAGFLRQQRERRVRQLAQVRLERELSRAGRPLAGPSPGIPAFDRSALESRAAMIRSQLAVDAGVPLTVLTVEERRARADAAQSLARPCLVCHELRGARLSAVRAAQSLLTSALFDHAPHVIQTTCVTCHPSAATSTSAADVNLPGIQTCRNCHGGERARASCVTCHRYHDASH